MRSRYSPTELAWESMLSTAQYHLDHMPAHDMMRAAHLRMFIRKARRAREECPGCVCGVTIGLAPFRPMSICAWVSEAPGGLITSVTLPLTTEWLKASAYCHASFFFRDYPG
jgi:hypothetical protein